MALNTINNLNVEILNLQGAPTYKVTLLPLIIFLSIALFIKFILLFTKFRFNFENREAIAKVVDFGALILALIIANTVSKYDDIGSSLTSFMLNMGYLQKVTLDYEPSLMCYLIDTLKIYENVDYAISNKEKIYSIHEFEKKIVPLIEDRDEVEAKKVSETVKVVNELLHKRLDAADMISNEFWLLLFLGLIILSILLLFDKHFGKLEGILAVILIWGPISYIYYLYYNRNKYIDITINAAIKDISENNIVCK